MPRGSNGTYTLPVGAFTPGTTIQSAQVNSDFSDIATALTQSLATTGVSAMTAPLPGSAGTAGAPGYAFSTDFTSGMFSPGQGQVALTAGGVQVLTVTQGGVSVQGSLTSTQGATPVGAMTMFAGSAAPAGWHFCDGSSVSTSTFSALFAVIGYTYGGAGANFNLPDMRGRVPAGFDAGNATGRMTGIPAGGVSAATLGSAGGEPGHTLIIAEFPAHNHPGTTSSSSSSSSASNETALHSHNFENVSDQAVGPGYGYFGGGTLVTRLDGSLDTPTSTESANHTHTVSTTTTTTTSVASQGSSNAHNNVQPTLIVNYIIFAGV